MKETSIIRNPLTIIAIFAGLAEVSGTAVLPLLDSSLQEIFIWFVMLFPVALVAAFFVTLNLNHSVLYAPSDFRNDDSFLAARSKQIAMARTSKLREELEVESVEPAATTLAPVISASSNGGVLSAEALKRTQRGTYFLAEELILNRLAKEYKGRFSRDSIVHAGTGFYLFDACVSDGDKMTGIEVKYQRDQHVNKSMLRNLVERLSGFYNQMSPRERDGFSVVLAIATDAPAASHDDIGRTVGSLVQSSAIPIEVRIFDLKDLERELEYGKP